MKIFQMKASFLIEDAPFVLGATNLERGPKILGAGNVSIYDPSWVACRTAKAAKAAF